MKKLIYITSVILLFVLLSACGSGNASEGDGDTVELDVALSIAENHIIMSSFPAFKEYVEAESDGRLKVNFIGGPEAISAANQGEAIRNGTIDISFLSTAYYSELVPEALVVNYSEFDYEEELERGGFDYLNEIHKEKINGILLGRIMPGEYQIYLQDEITSASDLDGLRIRASATYVPTITAYGGEATFIESGEVYTSLEQGVINGVAYTSVGTTEMGIENLINYAVTPTFNQLDFVALMNNDTWESLPEDLQQVLVDGSKVAYEQGGKNYEEFRAEEAELLKEAGVQEIVLEDSEEFLKTVTEASYEWLAERVDNIDELKKYFRE